MTQELPSWIKTKTPTGTDVIIDISKAVACEGNSVYFSGGKFIRIAAENWPDIWQAFEELARGFPFPRKQGT